MSGKGWTDTEKVGLFFQIIGKMGASIPWHELELPEGRTLKACQVMVDKEKTKIRKAKKAEGDEGEGGPATPKTPASGKKRGAKAIDEEDGSVKKKAKTPRKTKAKESAKEDSGNEGGDGEGLVKYESADDEFA